VAWWQQPFIQIALPIIITLVVANLSQNKRIDDLRDSINRRIDAVERRLDAIEQRLVHIETLLSDHDHRITALE